MCTSRTRNLRRATVFLVGIAVFPGSAFLPGTPDRTGTEAAAPPTIEAIGELIRTGHYPEAEAAARQLLPQVEAAHGPGSIQVAALLDLLVGALWQGGRAKGPDTRALAERALAIKEQVDGPSHPGVAVSLNALAMVLKEQGEFAQARSLYERALHIREQAFGPDDPQVADSLHSLAGLLLRSGDYEAALPLYRRALALREKVLGPDHADVAKSLNNLALLLWNMGEYAEAGPLYERAVRILEKLLGSDHPLVARGLANSALNLWSMGDYNGAKPLYERARTILEKTLGPENADVATVIDYQALLFHDAGDDGQARVLYRKAQAIFEHALGDDPRLAESLHNLAVLERDAGELDEARRLFDRSLAILEKVDGPGHPDVAKGLNALGLLLRDAGDEDGARSVLERALRIRQNTYGPDHPAVGETLLNLAQVLDAGGDPVGALDAALRAERIGREHLRHSVRGLSERQALGYAAVRTSGLGLALSLAAEAVDPDARRKVWDVFTQSRALVLDEMAARHRAVHGVQDSAVEQLAQSLDSTRRRLATLAIRGPEGEPPEVYRRLMDEARREEEDAERSLALRSAAFRHDQARAGVGLADILAALPPDSALVAYAYRGAVERPGPPSGARPESRGEDPCYLAFAVGPREVNPSLVRLGSAGEIDGLVRRWREAVGTAPGVVRVARRRAEDDYRQAGEALRRVIWDPLAPHLQGARRIFVVPDGSISLVNLATLPEGDAYLLESDAVIHYLSAERDLVHPYEEPAPGEGLLIIGAPDFDARASSSPIGPQSAARRPPARARDRGARRDGSFSAPERGRGLEAHCADFRSMRFSPLPGARAEAEEVAAAWRRGGAQSGATGGVLRLTGSAAGKAAFKQAAAGHRVLHLATHAFFLDDLCLSALTSDPATPSREAGPPPPVKGDSPLLLSGLALSGANRRVAPGSPVDADDDGILTAEEIASLDLSGVEWVVLSACQTGIGRIQAGEGVLGLRRAFRVAGARTLIMSLWRVEDEAAREWMKRLYKSRLSGLSTADAVRQASLSVLRDRRRAGGTTHPFYWGAFVADGDWR